MKQCTKCKKYKPLSEFSKNKHNKTGFCYQCKDCRKKYRQSDIGKQITNKAGRKYYQTHKKQEVIWRRKYRKTLTGYFRSRFTTIKQRCNNPKNAMYKYYGGRGIKCLFKNANEFIDYVINELKVNPRGLTIDRIDNNGHYEPGNIRFITNVENLKNRWKCKGKTKCKNMTL